MILLTLVWLLAACLHAASTVEFFGGAGEVGGSAALVENGDCRVLVDCGTVYDDDPKTNSASVFAFDPRSVQALFITHAHQDHSGRIPQLAREGFDGVIWTTSPSRELLRTVWKGQLAYENDVRRDWVWSVRSKQRTCHWRRDCEWAGKISDRNRQTFSGTMDELREHVKSSSHAWTHVSTCKTCQGLEADDLIRRVKVVDFGAVITQGVFKVVFRPVKHLPGAAAIYFSDGKSTWVFSGDLGSARSRFVDRVDPADPVDAVFVESTYGDASYGDANEVEAEYSRFGKCVGEMVSAGGIAWIPALSLDRSQRVMAELSRGMDAGIIPKDVPFYYLSPSSREFAEMYIAHPEWFDNDESKRIWPLYERSLRWFDAHKHSGAAILLTASGMMNAGSSYRLIPDLVSRTNVHVCLSGYLSPGTCGELLRRGRKVLKVRDGEKWRRVPVRCKVDAFSCFSGHADAREIDDWLVNNRGSQLFLVHGDKRGLKERKAGLESRFNAQVEIVNAGRKYPIVVKCNRGNAVQAVRAEVRPVVVTGAPFPLTVAEWTPPARDFPVVEYGAVSNSLPITDAITRAIDAASAAGGGRVILPKGEWLSGGLTLKSDVALVVPEGCTLCFPDDPVLVYGAPLRADGHPTVTRRGLIEALGCTNVAIMGGGVVKADVEYWHRNFSFNPPKGYPRPHFFNFRDCANVRFEGFKIRGSPAWTMHFTLCTDIVLRDLDSIATGPNTDGLDLESCNRALVERVSLDQTDDTFTFKSGMNAAGRKRNVPTQNVVIRNCRAVHGHSLLGIGSEVSGGVRNIFMTDCTVADECWRWLFVKTNSKRGAFVENITLQNITGRRASQAVMELTMYYDGNPNKELTKTTVSEFPTRIRGIVCRNITCAEAGAAVKINGDVTLPPAGLVAEDIAIGRLCKPVSQLVITNVAPDIVMRNVRLEESAFGRGLGLPESVRRFDPSRDAQSEVVIDRSDFENRADNAVMASVIDARIAAECRTGRNCVPRMVPMGRDYATKSFSIGHVERMEDAFADWGCAFDGAIVADDVSAVSMGGKAVAAELSVDAAESTARLTLTNQAAVDATELFVVFLAPTHYMMHRQLFRVERLASGESRTLDIELGAWARQMPPSQGAAPFAAQVDFSQDGARSRVWCRTDVSAGTTRPLPNDVAWSVGPLDANAATDETLCALSASEGVLANFDTEGGKWRRAAFPGVAATLVSGPKRPYTEKECKLVKAKRAVEIVALDFEVPDFAAVRMKFFIGKWGKKAEFFLNGKRLEKCNAQTVLPTQAGRNRLLVRYPSAPGDTRECAHLSVYTWNATNFVPFSDVEKDSSCK